MLINAVKINNLLTLTIKIIQNLMLTRHEFLFREQQQNKQPYIEKNPNYILLGVQKLKDAFQ
jgi:hypothetical protein